MTMCLKIGYINGENQDSPQDEKNSVFLTSVCKQKQIFLSDAGLACALAHLFPR